MSMTKTVRFSYPKKGPVEKEVEDKDPIALESCRREVSHQSVTGPGLLYHAP